MYATYVKYSRVGKSGTELVAPRGSSFDLAMAAYKNFFKIKTGKDWDDRFDGKLPEPKREQGNVLPPDEGWFRHELPTGLLASFFMQTEMSTVASSTSRSGNEKEEVHDQVRDSHLDEPEGVLNDQNEEDDNNIVQMASDSSDQDADKDDNTGVNDDTDLLSEMSVETVDT